MDYFWNIDLVTVVLLIFVTYVVIKSSLSFEEFLSILLVLWPFRKGLHTCQTKMVLAVIMQNVTSHLSNQNGPGSYHAERDFTLFKSKWSWQLSCRKGLHVKPKWSWQLNRKELHTCRTKMVLAVTMQKGISHLSNLNGPDNYHIERDFTLVKSKWSWQLSCRKGLYICQTKMSLPSVLISKS